MKMGSDRWITILFLCVVAACNSVSHMPVIEANLICGFKLEESVVICYPGTVVLQCKSDKHLKILKAEYERTENAYNLCRGYEVKTLDCKSFPNATQIAANLCDGQQRCHLKAKDEIFGDPCPWTGKYLKVKFCCTDTGTNLRNET